MTAIADAPARALTVLYDDRCAFCLRCKEWLEGQPCFVPVELLPARSEAAARRFPDVQHRGQELIVADDAGRVWVGPPAYLMCMWATARYRSWSYALSQPALAPLATRFFLWVSGRRARWSAWLHRDDPDCPWCATMEVSLRGGRL